MALELNANLKMRIISGAILAPIVLAIIWWGGVLFNLIMLVAAVVMAFEWNNITRDVDEDKRLKWLGIGIAYIVISVGSMMYLRNLPHGTTIVLFLLLSVWATDIAAYFSGKIIGGPKILPAISPNKTWAGLLGGMFAAAIVNIIIGGFSGAPILMMIFFGFVLAVISQAGDFFESWVKRLFKVKDSGTLIPGHGGLLDRIDGLTTTAPLVAFITLLNNGVMPIW